jgi:adenine/guanine phosphoribosyltransferase-like PRPP-binding protein/protein gp37
MLRIEDYYTDAPSAGIITMIEKPEVINRLMNIFYINFKGYDYNKMRVEIYPVREELEEYKDLSAAILNQIQRVRAYYDGHLIALKRVLNDINHDTHLNTKVYSPVVGCPINCSYCFSRKVVEHFAITDSYRKPVFRGPYKITKDADGNSIPELFNIESDNPIDWFLTYMSDFGCWKPEWQANILEQIIAANGVKRRSGKCCDTFQLVTKRPNGIDLSTIPVDTDLQNVVISCTVDKNDCTDRIPQLIEKTKAHRITACVVYQPVLEYIEPVHLDELVKTFGKDNTWVVVGSEIGADVQPIEFEWIKDIIDKCLELGIPLKMEYDIKALVEENGYEFLVQEPKPMRDTKAIRRNNLAIKNADKTEFFNLSFEGLQRNAENYTNIVKNDASVFVRFGNVEATEESASRLLYKSPAFDIILTVESKGIPLAYEMSKQSRKNYIVARRYAKHYMNDNNEAASNTGTEQRFYLSDDDLEALKGKRVLLVDNMVKTGESLRGLEALVKRAGGITAAKVAALAEGEAANRNDILFLEKLTASSSK